MCETAQAWEPRAHIFNHHFFKFITNILFCNPSYFTFQYLQQNICLTFLLIFLLQVWTRTLWQRPPTWCPRSTASMPSSLPARESARRSSADPSRHLLSSNLPKKDAKISQKYKERPKMSTSDILKHKNLPLFCAHCDRERGTTNGRGSSQRAFQNLQKPELESNPVCDIHKISLVIQSALLFVCLFVYLLQRLTRLKCLVTIKYWVNQVFIFISNTREGGKSKERLQWWNVRTIKSNY